MARFEVSRDSNSGVHLDYEHHADRDDYEGTRARVRFCADERTARRCRIEADAAPGRVAESVAPVAQGSS